MKARVGKVSDEMKHRFRYFLSFLTVVALLSTGCFSFGPRSIARDRFDYSEAISSSWKSQMLLNLVKIRYADAPVFMEVSSVINQYALEGQVSGGLNWNMPLVGDAQTLGGAARYADRPTITYLPLQGAKFTRTLMTPIPPISLFSLIQAAWPVDFIFRISIKSMNGIIMRLKSPPVR